MLNKFMVMAVIISTGALTGIAQAQEVSAAQENGQHENGQQDNEKCFPFKGIGKYYKKMNSLKPARMDTLEAVMMAKFIRADETAPLPEFWARHGGVDTPFDVSTDGRVTNFHSIVGRLPKEAELCGKVITPTGEKPKIGLEMDSDIRFKNLTGPYSLAELQDGVADGKSFYKKMMPGPMALLVPKMTHVMVLYDDENTVADLRFTQAGVAVSSPPVEKFSDAYVIDLEDIEASGADTMVVGGGPFMLSPVPSVKKMKSLGFGDDEGDDDEGVNEGGEND